MEPNDPFGLDVPFKERYYARKDRRENADRVSVAFRRCRTFREAVRLAVDTCYVPEAKALAVVSTPQKNAIRMMNLVRLVRATLKAAPSIPAL